MLIYCPVCAWEPSASSRWVCHDACGHMWNTFDTCGVCPKCGEVWQVTQCHRCRLASPHLDWYHDGPPADLSLKHREPHKKRE
jgi:hypothetical protein